MIDITKAKLELKKYLDKYEGKSDLSFNLKVTHTYHVAENSKNIAENLKVTHTYHVAENSKNIAEKLNLSKEDIELAELIGLLHDIGRFEELKITKELNSIKFDHATYGSKMLFEKGMIRNFVEDSQYDEIIKKAIENHSKLTIEKGLNERELLHSKIIRDADKLDNYRVKQEEKIEAIFPKRVKKKIWKKV